MDFALTNDQQLMQAQLDSALRRLCPLARVRRQAAPDADAFAEDIWDGLVGFGIPSLLVPEAFGGSGLGLLDAMLAAEALGRHVVPAPFLGTAVAAPLALLNSGNAVQQRTLLPRIANGSLRFGIALSASLAGARAEEGLEARRERVEGECRFVIDVAGSEIILVETRDGDLHLVQADDRNVEIVPLNTIDCTRSVAAATFRGAKAERLDVSLEGKAKIRSALRVMLAADLLGAGTHLLETAIDYSKVRHQFGRPIGSFQAVQHLCADVAAELEPGRALVWYAAHALDAGLPDATLCALHAKAYLADAARLAARNATEVHGGIGITDELGLHYWFKRVSWSSQALGGATRSREWAAAMQRLAAAARSSPVAPLAIPA